MTYTDITPYLPDVHTTVRWISADPWWSYGSILSTAFVEMIEEHKFPKVTICDVWLPITLWTLQGCCYCWQERPSETTPSAPDHYPITRTANSAARHAGWALALIEKWHLCCDIPRAGNSVCVDSCGGHGENRYSR